MEKATPMTIIIEIKLEVQAELSRQAAAGGVDIGSYAASLLEEAAHFRAGSTLSQSQLDATLQELAQFSHKIPLLPDEAFSRESLGSGSGLMPGGDACLLGQQHPVLVAEGYSSAIPRGRLGSLERLDPPTRQDRLKAIRDAPNDAGDSILASAD